MPTPITVFKAALAKAAMQYGCWVGFGEPYGIEMLASAGFDWLVMDELAV